MCSYIGDDLYLTSVYKVVMPQRDIDYDITDKY
jgi:hypothetical protein